MPTVYDLDLVRAVHRAVASLTLVVVAALVVIALGLRPRDWQAGTPALALLGLALGLAVLGIFTSGSSGAAVLLGNMLGGFSMLALAWRMTRSRAALDGAVARSVNRRASIAVVLWGGQAAFGAVSGTGAGMVIAIAHPVLGLVVSLWVFSLAALARRSGLFGEGTALLVIAMIQWPLGICAALLAAPPLLVFLHNTTAAFGIALLVGLIGRGVR